MANQNVLDLRDVTAKGAALEGQIVTVEGWVRNHRKQKSIGFIEFFDGTVLTPMQIVYDDKVKDFAAVQAIRNGAAVRATGKLVPGSGELMGGSERETRLDVLTGRMDELHISKEQMDWYVNLRRFGGCTHSGFGMGFERLIMYLTDIENIRDVIPYPRTPGNCEF